MNVKIIKTGKVETVNTSYGMRLIEQGKAVPHKETKQADAGKERAARKAADA